MVRPCLHFVGFRGDEFGRAIRVFGQPDFIHRWWDFRAACDIAPGDTVVFATGDESQPFNPYAYDDSSAF